MKIIKVEDSEKTSFLELLLLADESLEMIEKYIHRGEMFALCDYSIKGVCVVTRESHDVCELKNIAVYEKWHGKGYGSKMLSYIFSHYKGKYATILVGTGDTPSMQFYQKNGFKISRRIKDFFIDNNYDHPMFENGVQLVDMVYLSKSL